MTQNPYNQNRDNSVSSFVTGTVVGAILALTLGTEDGRKFAKSLVKTVKALGEELEKQSHNLPSREQTQSRLNDLAQNIQSINSTVQNVGNNLITRLHRDTSEQTFFHRDPTPES